MKLTPKKLHIAIVSDAIYPYNIGGKEKRIYELSKRLVNKGHFVTIYCMKWWKEKEQIVQHEGVTFGAISPYYPLYAKERRSIKEGILFSLHTFKLLKKNFDVIDVDHMPHLVLFPTKIVCLLKGKKMIATWHEVWGQTYWKKYLGKLGFLAYGVEFLSIKLPNIIITGSHHTADKLSSDFNRRKHVYPVPNGIDVSIMNKIPDREKNIDIIFAGRLLKHKNVHLLLYAIKELQKTNPTISCLIIGNGPEERRLKQLRVKLELQNNVTFQDFLEDNTAFYSLIKSARVFVLPSSREGFGISTLEAQTLGVPVVTYDHKNNGSRKLIIEGKNGYLFDKTHTSLHKAIAILLEKNLSGRLVKETAKNYDWNHIVKQIEEVYRS